jgi:hypothetical protein
MSRGRPSRAVEISFICRSCATGTLFIPLPGPHAVALAPIFVPAASAPGATAPIFPPMPVPVTQVSCAEDATEPNGESGNQNILGDFEASYDLGWDYLWEPAE